MATAPKDFFRIAAIAAETLALPLAKVEMVASLKGGLTNESWHVRVAGIDIVVRISTADEALLQINRASECRVLAVVEQAGVGPEVLRCDPPGRLLVTRYVPGRVWTQEDAAAPDNIRRLAGLLRGLHSLECRADVAAIEFPAILKAYWATLAVRDLPDPPGSLGREPMLQIAHELLQGVTKCLCHNDVHHLNILDTGRLWLIDWEYAGIGSPWFDLAAVCCNHSYDDTQRHLLLKAYLGSEDRDANRRLHLACTLFDYVRCLWLAVRGN